MPDPERIKQRINRANLLCYQYKHWTENLLTLIDPCTSGWVREANDDLSPLWFNGKQFPDELTKEAKAKTAEKPTNAEDQVSPQAQQELEPAAERSRPQRFSAQVEKYRLQESADVDISEEDESECSDDDSSSESDSSENDNDSLYT